jgi:hypothetical protein
MTFLHLLPVVLSYLLMAAHLFRGHHYLLMALAALVPLLLVIPRPWAARAVQAGLAISTVEWLRTIAWLIQERMAFGQPYARMALILGAVALMTLGSAFVFYRDALSRRYKLEP